MFPTQEQYHPQGNHHETQGEEMPHLHSGYVEHGQADERQEHRTGEIILQINQGDEQDHDDKGRQETVHHVSQPILLFSEDVRQIQDEGEFDQLRGLKGVARHCDPAPGSQVLDPDTGNECHYHENDGQKNEDGNQLPEGVDGKKHRHRGGDKTQRGIDGLAPDEVKWIVEQKIRPVI
jgi:hypothetical protein